MTASDITGSVDVVPQLSHAVTVKVTELLTISPLKPGELAVMLVIPVQAPEAVKPVAVASPELAMAATCGALECQVTSAVISLVTGG